MTIIIYDHHIFTVQATGLKIFIYLLIGFTNSWKILIFLKFQKIKIGKQNRDLHSQLENVTVIEFFVSIWIFSIQFIFTNSIQITELKYLFDDHQKQTSIWIQHFLYHINSNNWRIQTIEYLNLKSLNFVKFQIGIQTNSEFLIYVKLWH